MPEEYMEAGGNTEAFRAFVHAPEPAAADPSVKRPLIIGAAVAAVVVIVLVAWAVLS